MSSPGAEFSGSELLNRPMQGSESPSRALAPQPLMAPPGLAMAGGGYGGGGAAGPEILYGGFNQMWLMNCLRRRWLLALLMGLLIGAVLGGLLLWLFPESSRVTAYLEVKSDTSNPMKSDKERPISPQEMERDAQSHISLLKSNLVLEAALQSPGISQLEAVQNHKSDAVLWLLDELKVSFPDEGKILEIRYEGDENPADMVKLIDAIVNSYKDRVLLQDQLVSVSTHDDLNLVLTEMQGKVAELLEKYKDVANKSGVMTEEVELPKLQGEIRTQQEMLSDAQKELVDVEVMKQLAVQSAKSPAALEQAVAYEVDKDPSVANYKQQIFALDQQISEKQQRSRNPNNAELRRLLATREQIGGMMKQTQAALERDARDRLSKLPNEGLRQAIVEYNIRVASCNARIKEAEEKLEAANTRMLELGVRNPELEMLEANITNQQAVVSELQQKMLNFRAGQQAFDRGQGGQGSEFEKVRVVQKATPTEQINTIERLLIAAVGGLAGLALTCYGVALMEFRHRRLNGPGDIEKRENEGGLGIRVLGVLPQTNLKALTGRSLVATQVAEAIDNVRATLMHGSTSKRRQVVMVTSSNTLEGTTTVASSLALSLARAGRRTLLVDGDVRSPDIHKLFGMSLEDGVCEVLRAEAELADAVRPTNNENLYLLSAGVCDPEAVNALSTDQPQAIFDKLRDQFDFVVIDAPPVLQVADGRAIGQYVDAAILTVLRDHSEIPSIHQATETLQHLGIPLLGVVVNGVPVKADRRVLRLHQAASSRAPQLEVKASDEE